MSDTLTGLAQYLLAYQLPGGGKPARYGTVGYTVPVLPPGISVSFSIYPQFNNYCSILIWHQWSPAIVPNTLFFNSHHQGLALQSGLLTALALSDSYNIWLEVTENNPITTTIQNVSGLNQYFEARDLYLVVQEERDMCIVYELIRAYGNAKGLDFNACSMGLRGYK